MKEKIHPKYYPAAKVACACGNVFTIGSTLPELHVEICSSCHPFYTGKQKLLDAARRVEKFEERVSKKSALAATRLGKKAKKAKLATGRKKAKKEEE